MVQNTNSMAISSLNKLCYDLPCSVNPVIKICYNATNSLVVCKAKMQSRRALKKSNNSMKYKYTSMAHKCPAFVLIHIGQFPKFTRQHCNKTQNLEPNNVVSRIMALQYIVI